jgi:hypothetical protein
MTYFNTRSLRYYACKRAKIDGVKTILSHEMKLLLSLQISLVKNKNLYFYA